VGFPTRPLRNFSQRLMTEDTEILRFTEVEEEPGYPRQTWTTVETTKSYGLPLGQREVMRASQEGYQAEGKRLLPVGTDVQREDRIKVAGKTYEIVGITEMTEALQAHTEVLVSRAE
jgi:SPP1 family predicted phage head-tail adaptor